MKIFSLNKIVCLAGLVVAAWCGRGLAQSLNTAGEFLVRGQPAVITSPRFVVYAADLLLVTTNRVTLGYFSSFAGNLAADYTAPNPPPPAVPTLPTFFGSVDGTNWVTSPVGTNCYIAVSASSAVYVTNVTVRGFSHRYNQTNDFVGQKLLVDTPELQRQAANKSYVDFATSTNRPRDWANYPAGNGVQVNGQPVFYGNGFSSTTDSGTNVVALTFRIGGQPLMKLESNPALLSSNPPATILVTNATVTIGVLSNGIATRPVVFTTTNFLSGHWVEVSTLTTVTESYPVGVDGYFTISFPQLPGENWFTVYLESAGAFRRVTINAPVVSYGETNYFAGTTWINELWTDGVQASGTIETTDTMRATGLISSGTGFAGDGGNLTNVSPRYAAFGFPNATINGTFTHLHPFNGASHSDWRVTAWRPTRNVRIAELATYINYASHVDTNYFWLFTNGVSTGVLLSNYVGSAGSTANVTLATNTPNFYVPAGTRVTIGVTNRGNANRQIYGECNMLYYVE